MWLPVLSNVGDTIVCPEIYSGEHAGPALHADTVACVVLAQQRRRQRFD